MKKKLNWAVFNLETKFRLTNYATRVSANLAYRKILEDQPNLMKKIGIRQKGLENQKLKGNTTP